MTKYALARAVSRLGSAIRSRVRYDGASFLGATICALSLFFPWVVRVFPPWYRWHPGHGFILWPMPKMEWSFFDLVQNPYFTVLLLAFLIGTFVSFFFRMGIVLQAVGLFGFILSVRSHFIPEFSESLTNLWDRPDNQFYLAPGYFIALVGLFVSMFAAKNFWWQRSSHPVVPSISRVVALNPNSTRPAR